MTLRSQMSKIRQGALCSFYRRSVSLRDPHALISITFDDFPISALTAGGEILERFGGRATYYVSMGLMGTTNKLGEQFRPQDLRSLVARGHELGSHTLSHSSARKTPVSQFLRDVDRGEKAILESLGISPSKNFAYPYGDVTLASKMELGPRMESCRGTFGGLNGPDVDLNLLRANRLYGGIEQFKAARQLILENERHKGWLIFYSHDVAGSPSPFGCTPALLEAVVSFAAERGVKMETVESITSKLRQAASPGKSLSLSLAKTVCLASVGPE
jgi:peptidoglycan/xylan/chitin deacetylase (PgdA/CDA1 family)